MKGLLIDNPFILVLPNKFDFSTLIIEKCAFLCYNNNESIFGGMCDERFL